ncbi:unnamed protein product [Paramecium sonneborni]|uniref:Uncharacterized protein n=1 Tax=Paramecium sonneborni TaxID=65129 RepID=A0A8S1NNE6_9CILI|nr:unnamed protein product [Paramecium sonneborni]
MIEKEEDLFCSLQLFDKELIKNQRLLCPLGIKNFESKAKIIMMNFKKAPENILENQKSKKEFVESVLMTQIKSLEQLQKFFINQNLMLFNYWSI